MLPEFPQSINIEKLTKEYYDQCVSAYPPISDISYATLKIWWNFNDQLVLSTLHGNLIIPYQAPGADQSVKFSVVGTKDIDQTIDELFKYSSRHNILPLKLVHVPEFTVKHIRNLARLNITAEPNYSEYLYDAGALASMEGSDLSQYRKKVTRFKREHTNIRTTKLDFNEPELLTKLLSLYDSWSITNGSKNDAAKDERSAMTISISKANELSIAGFCLYVDDVLQGYALYDLPHDSNSMIVRHIKVNSSLPYIFDYILNRTAAIARDNHVGTVNLEMDLGIDGLRTYKNRLRPKGLYRKFTITPKY